VGLGGFVGAGVVDGVGVLVRVGFTGDVLMLQPVPETPKRIITVRVRIFVFI
jgi:hypothetical protein